MIMNRKRALNTLAASPFIQIVPRLAVLGEPRSIPLGFKPPVRHCQMA